MSDIEKSWLYKKMEELVGECFKGIVEDEIFYYKVIEISKDIVDGPIFNVIHIEEEDLSNIEKYHMDITEIYKCEHIEESEFNEIRDKSREKFEKKLRLLE